LRIIAHARKSLRIDAKTVKRLDFENNCEKGAINGASLARPPIQPFRPSCELRVASCELRAARNCRNEAPSSRRNCKSRPGSDSISIQFHRSVSNHGHTMRTRARIPRKRRRIFARTRSFFFLSFLFFFEKGTIRTNSERDVAFRWLYRFDCFEYLSINGREEGRGCYFGTLGKITRSMRDRLIVVDFNPLIIRFTADVYPFILISISSASCALLGYSFRDRALHEEKP